MRRSAFCLFQCSNGGWIRPPEIGRNAPKRFLSISIPRGLRFWCCFIRRRFFVVMRRSAFCLFQLKSRKSAPSGYEKVVMRRSAFCLFQSRPMDSRKHYPWRRRNAPKRFLSISIAPWPSPLIATSSVPVVMRRSAFCLFQSGYTSRRKGTGRPLALVVMRRSAFCLFQCTAFWVTQIT